MSFLHQRLSAEQQVLPYVQQAAISVMTWLWLTNGALLFLALKARCSSNWPITLTDSFIRHQPDTAAMQCGVETIAGGCLLTRIARHRTCTSARQFDIEVVHQAPQPASQPALVSGSQVARTEADRSPPWHKVEHKTTSCFCQSEQCSGEY